jgi:hypothetical protein
LQPGKIGMARRSTQPRHPLRRLGVAACLVALSLAVSASPATAAVTIGQTAPSTDDCGESDRLQPTVTSGNAYVVPSTVPNWTVTSWSTQASAGGAGQMLAMKVYRPLGGVTYMIVGHDGPRLLAQSTLNTFPASVAVKAGDVLGNSSPAAGGDPACTFAVAGESHLRRLGNLADGASGDFAPGPIPDRRVNISAVITPTNSFSLGEVGRNKRKGTATLTVEDVPNPGELVASGEGVKGASAAGAVVAKTVTAPGDVKLIIRAKGKKKRKLNETGKVKVMATITFTPTGGDPNAQSRKLKLKKR